MLTMELTRSEKLNVIKGIAQKAMDNKIYPQFRKELDKQVKSLGLSNKVRESELGDYLSCCMVAYDEVILKMKKAN